MPWGPGKQIIKAATCGPRPYILPRAVALNVIVAIGEHVIYDKLLKPKINGFTNIP